MFIQLKKAPIEAKSFGYSVEFFLKRELRSSMTDNLDECIVYIILNRNDDAYIYVYLYLYIRV